MQTLTQTAVRLNNLSGSAADLDDSPDAPDTSGDEAGTHSRFNVITNMGNGQGCIIYQPGRDTPCYFYKLPPVAI